MSRKEDGERAAASLLYALSVPSDHLALCKSPETETDQEPPNETRVPFQSLQASASMRMLSLSLSHLPRPAMAPPPRLIGVFSLCLNLWSRVPRRGRTVGDVAAQVL